MSNILMEALKELRHLNEEATEDKQDTLNDLADEVLKEMIEGVLTEENVFSKLINKIKSRKQADNDYQISLEATRLLDDLSDITQRWYEGEVTYSDFRSEMYNAAKILKGLTNNGNSLLSDDVFKALINKAIEQKPGGLTDAERAEIENVNTLSPEFSNKKKWIEGTYAFSYNAEAKAALEAAETALAKAKEEADKQELTILVQDRKNYVAATKAVIAKALVELLQLAKTAEDQKAAAEMIEKFGMKKDELNSLSETAREAQNTFASFRKTNKDVISHWTKTATRKGEAPKQEPSPQADAETSEQTPDQTNETDPAAGEDAVSGDASDKNIKRQKTRQANTKIIKAFKDAGLDINSLMVKNGQGKAKASAQLNKLRKALFGEELEESFDDELDLIEVSKE